MKITEEKLNNYPPEIIYQYISDTVDKVLKSYDFLNISKDEIKRIIIKDLLAFITNKSYKKNLIR